MSVPAACAVLFSTPPFLSSDMLRVAHLAAGLGQRLRQQSNSSAHVLCKSLETKLAATTSQGSLPCSRPATDAASAIMLSSTGSMPPRPLPADTPQSKARSASVSHHALNECASTNASTSASHHALDECFVTNASTSASHCALNQCTTANASTSASHHALNECTTTNASTSASHCALNQCTTANGSTSASHHALDECTKTNESPSASHHALNDCTTTNASTSASHFALNQCTAAYASGVARQVNTHTQSQHSWLNQVCCFQQSPLWPTPEPMAAKMASRPGGAWGCCGWAARCDGKLGGPVGLAG
eukprot:280112-Pelagomonas_calceolata.AAC.3